MNVLTRQLGIMADLGMGEGREFVDYNENQNFPPGGVIYNWAGADDLKDYSGTPAQWAAIQAAQAEMKNNNTIIIATYNKMKDISARLKLDSDDNVYFEAPDGSEVTLTETGAKKVDTKQEITDIKDEMSTVSTQSKETTEKMQEVSAEMTAVSGKMDTVTAEMAAVTTDMEGVKSDIATTNTNLDTTNTNLATTNTNLATTNTNLADVKTTAQSAMPIGTCIFFASNGAPSGRGWLYCNGAAVSRTTYAALFAVIGTTWGAGDDSTTFNLPNPVGRYFKGNASAQYANAGLPNITGWGESGVWTDIWSSKDNAQYGFTGGGAFSWTQASVEKGNNSGYDSNGAGGRLNFNAASSNSLYGASSTVQPVTIGMKVYIKASL